MKKILWISILVLLVGIFVYSQFLYMDRPNGCFITIAPSVLELNNGTVKEALRLLRHETPNAYQDVCKNVKHINPNLSCFGTNWGGCFHHPSDEDDQKKIDISTAHKDILWTASVIVHEACHSEQNLEERAYTESECYERGYDIIFQLVKANEDE